MNFLMAIVLFFTINIVNASWFSSSEGELHIKSNKKGADIYIDGKKRGIVGDGFTIITVNKGKHKVRIFQHTKEWNYEGIENTFVGEKSSIELYIQTYKTASKHRINRLAKVEKEEQERLKKIAKIEGQSVRARVELIKQKLIKYYEQDFKHYIDNNDGTITNPETKLMWKRCVEGQIWKAVLTCEGDDNKYQWQEAINHARSINYAGYSDWRIPTINELKTIIYCPGGKFSLYGGCSDDTYYQVTIINPIAFPNTSIKEFWSSTPSKLAFIENTFNYLTFNNNFSSGSTNYGNFSIRLVRSLKE